MLSEHLACHLCMPVRSDNILRSTWANCRGLHFLAIQSDEEAEESSGLWLLQEYLGAPA